MKTREGREKMANTREGPGAQWDPCPPKVTEGSFDCTEGEVKKNQSHWGTLGISYTLPGGCRLTANGLI